MFGRNELRRFGRSLLQFGPIGVVFWILSGAMMSGIFDVSLVAGVALITAIFIGSFGVVRILFGLMWLGEYLANRFFPEIFP